MLFDVLFASSSVPSANTEVVTLSCVVCLRCTTNLNNNNNNNNILQLGCYPVAVVILHVYKT